MEDNGLSKSLILYSLIIASAIILLQLTIYFYDNKTTVVFCNVGQGDGAYIRVKNKLDIVIDAGPDDSILRCLGKYMPFFDRTIEMAFISHPQKDHYFGFLSIADRYKIEKVFMTPLNSNNISFKILLNKLKNQHTTVYFPLNITTLSFLGCKIQFLWPREDFLLKNLEGFADSNNQNLLDNKGMLGSTTANLYNSTVDPNMFSLIFAYEEENQRILFTGDSSEEILNMLSEKSEVKTTILKIPHHGSKNGLNRQFLQLADPLVAVISVGKKNRYNHPSTDILSMLKQENYSYLRTDQEDDIVYTISNNSLKRKRAR